MINQTISHYKILEKLGEGGMGEVYLAEDTKLDRKVALKFLPHHAWLDADANARFQREAKAAAALNHPNIITVYEIGEHEGRAFITMEYIKGQSLREKIKSATAPLPIDEVINLVSQVCDGLAAAHQTGITHRDLKPENLMIAADGRVKILDFGLAKLKGVTKLTADAITLGTISYMSPEQARGEEVDHHTDIWSLGVVLYEMLTGQLPFKGEYELAVVYSILNEEPLPASTVRKDVPQRFEQIIRRCLEKDLALRYQKIEEFLQEIKTPDSTPIPRKQKKSIAVLPFANMSADPEQEYFCDGMAEEIINVLTHVDNLKVIARTSAFVFKGRHEDVREIGRKLNVETLLDGSIRKAGNRIRITVQLVNVADGSHLWSERYDRNMDDVFAIQDEISLAVVDNLKVKLQGKERKLLVKRYTDNPDVYNSYLLGRYFFNKGTPDGYKKSVEYFEQAIQKDPNYAPAYAGLTECYLWLGGAESMGVKEAYTKAKEAASKALELDDTLAEAHTAIAIVKSFFEWDWQGADNEFRRAIELNPNSAVSHYQYAIILGNLGRLDECIAELIRTLELDPLWVRVHQSLGYFTFLARRFEESISHNQKALELEPDMAVAHWSLGLVYLQMSIYEQAITEFEKAVELSLGGPFYKGGLGFACTVVNNKDKAREILHELKQLSNQTYVSPVLIAQIYIGLEEIDEAFRWLDKAYKERDTLLFTIPTFLWFDPIRSDQRFSDLLKKLGVGE